MEKTEKMEGKKRKGLTSDQKERIGEIRKIAESKVAEAEIMMNDKVSKALQDPSVVEVLREGFQKEKRKIEEKAENNIEKIRDEE